MNFHISRFTESIIPHTICVALILGCLSLPGCQPSLSFQKKYTLAPSEIIPLPIDAIGHAQTIYVRAKSVNGADFTCHVYLVKDDLEVERALTTGGPSDKILAASEFSTEVNLTAKIPANEATVVRIAAHSHKATVDVSIHN